MINKDDLVFEAVRARVESGDYLDERFGPPGVDTKGGGAFRATPDGQLQQTYWRGTPDYTAAQAAGLFEPLPPLTPASGEAVTLPPRATMVARSLAAHGQSAVDDLRLGMWHRLLRRQHRPDQPDVGDRPEPAPAENQEVLLFPQHLGYTEWMRRWVEGTLRSAPQT